MTAPHFASALVNPARRPRNSATPTSTQPPVSHSRCLYARKPCGLLPQRQIDQDDLLLALSLQRGAGRVNRVEPNGGTPGFQPAGFFLAGFLGHLPSHCLARGSYNVAMNPVIPRGPGVIAGWQIVPCFEQPEFQLPVPCKISLDREYGLTVLAASGTGSGARSVGRCAQIVPRLRSNCSSRYIHRRLPTLQPVADAIEDVFQRIRGAMKRPLVPGYD